MMSGFERLDTPSLMFIDSTIYRASLSVNTLHLQMVVCPSVLGKLYNLKIEVPICNFLSLSSIFTFIVIPYSIQLSVLVFRVFLLLPFSRRQWLTFSQAGQSVSISLLQRTDFKYLVKFWKI